MKLSFSLLLSVWATKACLFGLKKPEPKHCGEICTKGWCDEEKECRWNLYVVVEDAEKGILEPPRICFGTIIASNLIITSMRCLIGNNTFQVFQTWNSFSLQSISNISRVKVIPSTFINNEREQNMSLEIEKIFFSPRYAVSKSVNSFIENDVALIVLKGNLFSAENNSSARYRPVCFGADGMELKQFQLYTFKANIPGYTKYRPPPWNIHKTCVLNQTVENVVSKKNVLEKVSGEVVSLGKCNAVFDLIWNDAPETNASRTFCFRFQSQNQLLTGHPLLASSGPVKYDSTPNCLIGISTYGSTISDDDGYNYAYFTNILRKSNQAEFCYDDSTNEETGSFSEIESRITETSYPWQKLDSDITRNISLDCVCGLLQRGKPQEEIDSPQHSMGWISLIRVQRGMDETECVGNLINNKYVIVAAHCLLLNNMLTITDAPTDKYVDVTNIQVFLDVADHRNLAAATLKQVAKIRIHPGFGKHWINDIAIVVLEDPVEFAKCGKGRRPACLPDFTKYEGHRAFGWRAYGENEELVYWNYLQQEIYRQPVFQCKNISINGHQILADKKVCYHRVGIGGVKETHEFPQGVSNEPLYGLSESKQWTLLGLGNWRTEGKHPIPSYDDKNGGIVVFYNLNEMDAFVDYYANLDGAKWCNERLARK